MILHYKHVGLGQWIMLVWYFFVIGCITHYDLNISIHIYKAQVLMSLYHNHMIYIKDRLYVLL